MIYLHEGCKFCENWADGFKQCLNNLNIKFETCDIFNFDFKKIKNRDFLLGRYNEFCLDIKSKYEEINYLFKGKVWPNLLSIKLYDDKINQFTFFKENKIPHPKTIVLNNKEDIISFNYPCVFKKSNGSSSKNVKLINSENEINEYPCIIQEYCKNNDFDLRINIIGHRLFGFKRLNRDNDFRASGSGSIVEINNIPDECIEIIKKIYLSKKIHTMAFDFVKNNNKWVVLEMSYTFQVPPIINHCKFWINILNNSKINEIPNPTKWIIEDLFLKSIY